MVNQSKQALISKAFSQYNEQIYFYLLRRIQNADDARDMTQDVFLKLMEYGDTVCEETVKSFVFTIAHNLLIDFVRRHVKRMEIEEYFKNYYGDEASICTQPADQETIVKDILALEEKRMALLPPQRQKIYKMRRFDDLSIPEIAEQMGLSRRTVENHLALGRTDVQTYMIKVIKKTV